MGVQSMSTTSPLFFFLIFLGQEAFLLHLIGQSTSPMHAGQPRKCMHSWGWQVRLTGACRHKLNHPSLGIWSTSLIQLLTVIYSQRSTSHMHIDQPHKCMHLWGWLVRLTWFILGACRHRLNHPSLGIWSTSLIQVLSVIYSQRSTSHMHIDQPHECILVNLTYACICEVD